MKLIDALPAVAPMPQAISIARKSTSSSTMFSITPRSQNATRPPRLTASTAWGANCQFYQFHQPCFSGVSLNVNPLLKAFAN